MYHTKSSTPRKRARNSWQMIWLDFLRKKGNVTSFAQILVDLETTWETVERRQEALLAKRAESQCRRTYSGETPPCVSVLFTVRPRSPRSRWGWDGAGVR